MFLSKNRTNITRLLLFVLFISISTTIAYAAVGCTLNNPDSDIKRLFPDSTSYKTVFLQIDQHGGKSMYQKVQKLLGDKFDTVYETIDVPYAYYKIFKGNKIDRIYPWSQPEGKIRWNADYSRH